MLGHLSYHCRMMCEGMPAGESGLADPAEVCQELSQLFWVPLQALPERACRTPSCFETVIFFSAQPPRACPLSAAYAWQSAWPAPFFSCLRCLRGGRRLGGHQGLELDLQAGVCLLTTFA